MKQTISTILASVMAVLAFDSTIVMADELTLRGSRDASTRSSSSSSSYLDTVIRNLGYSGSDGTNDTSGRQYRMIKTKNDDHYEYCWDAQDDYYLYGRETNCNGSTQQLFYYEPKYGQIKSKKWGDNYCLTHDLDDYYYGGYLYFAKCHYGATQSWSYWDLHWTNRHNGKCADIYRNHPGNGRYHLQDCHDLYDQKHPIYYYDNQQYGWFGYTH